MVVDEPQVVTVSGGFDTAVTVGRQAQAALGRDVPYLLGWDSLTYPG